MRIVTAGLALTIVGVAIFAVTLVRLIDGAALEPQSKVPGSVSALIDVPGRYYVWDNHRTMFDGQRVQYPADWPDDATVAVRDVNGMELVFVPDPSQNWYLGNNGKTSIGYVDVPEATTIQIDIGDLEHERIVTVSNRTMKQELWSRLGGFGIGLAIGAAGVPVCVMVLLLRRRTSNAGSDANLEHIG